jgi:hypothetical protein
LVSSYQINGHAHSCTVSALRSLTTPRFTNQKFRRQL